MVTERNEKTPDMSVLPRGVRRALDAMQAAVERDIGTARRAPAGFPARAAAAIPTFLGKTPVEALHDIRFDSHGAICCRACPARR